MAAGREDAPDADRTSAPHFRIWPPMAIAVPWLLGFTIERITGVEADLGRTSALIGWCLIGAFAVWNGWCLVLFARHGTGLLPGQSTSGLLTGGPYRYSRNPLYVGLLALYVGTGLVASSWAVLALTPVAWAGLHWGAVLPEERYLRGRLGDQYVAYTRRVRRWI
jgi:protein-S-isoprenylcysteine O-methyltransferase Ste14